MAKFCYACTPEVPTKGLQDQIWLILHRIFPRLENLPSLSIHIAVPLINAVSSISDRVDHYFVTPVCPELRTEIYESLVRQLCGITNLLDFCQIPDTSPQISKTDHQTPDTEIRYPSSIAYLRDLDDFNGYDNNDAHSNPSPVQGTDVGSSLVQDQQVQGNPSDGKGKCRILKSGFY
jgi:hypothetical protein